MGYCDSTSILVLSLQLTYIVAVFGYPGDITKDAPAVEQEITSYTNDNNHGRGDKNIVAINPKYSANNNNATESESQITNFENASEDSVSKSDDLNTTENVTKNINATSEKITESNGSVSDDIITAENINENNDTIAENSTKISGSASDYVITTEIVTENYEETAAVSPHNNYNEETRWSPYEEERLKALRLKEQREARRKRRKNKVAECTFTKYVKIQDEYGCEMCTCIYEKSMMLCSPFECQRNSYLGQEVDANTYNDYIIGVPSHFSEFECTQGDAIQASSVCVCNCIRQNILSCPGTCSFGRPLN